MIINSNLEIPYKSDFVSLYQSLRAPWRTPVEEALMLAYWMMPKETLLQHDVTYGDLCWATQNLTSEDHFEDYSPIDVENDDSWEIAEKALNRIQHLSNPYAQMVLGARPGDVTPEGKEVRN